MDERLRNFKNLDNVVFIQVHRDNILYVQFPPGSNEDTKIKLLGNGNPVGKFTWNYISKLESMGYWMVMLDSGSVFDDEQMDVSSNSIQSFEIALMYLKDKNKILFYENFESSDNQTLYYSSLQPIMGRFDMEWWNTHTQICKKQLENAKDLVEYDYRAKALEVFLEMHYRIIGIYEKSDKERIEFVKNWYKPIQYDKNTVLQVCANFKSGRFDTRFDVASRSSSWDDKLTTHRAVITEIDYRSIHIGLNTWYKYKDKSLPEICREILEKAFIEVPEVTPLTIIGEDVLHMINASFYIRDSVTILYKRTEVQTKLENMMREIMGEEKF